MTRQGQFPFFRFNGKQQAPDMQLPADGMPEGAPEPFAKRIGAEQIEQAIKWLREYKDGKASIEQTIVENEQWYQLRHWEMIRNPNASTLPNETRPEPRSAWLFNSLANKHADAMDNFPEPNVLPREEMDEQDAKTLSAILPVILERNDFEQTYSDAWWYKLKHGAAAYGVFWNPELENGLGDIDIHLIDLLNIFWEPGVKDIQKSRNLFVVNQLNNDILEGMYPQLKGKLKGNAVEVKEYVKKDYVDNSEKTVVVDWYYKVKQDGRTLLHLCKFVGSYQGAEILFSSENDPQYAQTGFYEHGQYPVVLDAMFPEEGNPVGFGYLSIMKDPQLYTDKLGQAILEHALMGSKVRYFASDSLNINMDDFADWNKPIISVAGQISTDRLQPVQVPVLNNVYLEIQQQKIDELKETSSNRDFSQGGSASGVTAAAAIAALQEAGNKTSRDNIGSSYRAYSKINYLNIENIRQFYDVKRSFRITGQGGEYEFVDYSNQRIKPQQLQPSMLGGDMEASRRPVFDIRIKPQKRSPYSQMAQNEQAKELYGMGFFDPSKAEMALGALDMMAFEGREKVVERVQQGQTLMNIIQQMKQQMDSMALIIQAKTGVDMGIGQQLGGGGGGSPGSAPQMGGGGGMGGAVKDAQTPMTNYGQQLAQRAVPNMQSTGKVGMK